MEEFLQKIKASFPRSVVQHQKNYVSFTFGGGLYYQLRVQKDKVRMMATNYPAKAGLGECLELIRKFGIENAEINKRKIIFQPGVKNPDIFSLCLEFHYTGDELNSTEFIKDVTESIVAFHETLLPLVNQFQKKPVGNLFSLMGSEEKSGSENTESDKTSAPTKRPDMKIYTLNYRLNNRITYSTNGKEAIIDGDTQKMEQLTSSYGTMDFYIELDSDNNTDYEYSIKGKGYDANEIREKYLFAENFCDGLGSIEVLTDKPESIIADVVQGGLIQSVRDANGKRFDIFKNGEFCGEVVEYDSPEVQKLFFLRVKNVFEVAVLNGDDIESLC